MLMTLRILRVIAGFVAIWQIIGLLPVLTWFSNVNAITGKMLAFVVAKLIVLLIFSTTFYWLGRVKKRYEPAGVTTSELPAIGFAIFAFFVLALVLAFVIPNPNNESSQQSGTMVSHTLAPPTADSEAPSQSKPTSIGSFVSTSYQDADLEARAKQWYLIYPFLDVDSPVANVSAIERVVKRRNELWSPEKGITAIDALDMAVKEIAPQYAQPANPAGGGK